MSEAPDGNAGGDGAAADAAASADLLLAADLYRQMIAASGVPDAFGEAHLTRNCQRYADDPGKADALRLCSELAGSGFIEQNGAVRHGLLLSGSHGTGKTWLATATLKALMWREAVRLSADASNNRYSEAAQVARNKGEAPVRLPRHVWSEAFMLDEEVKDAISTGASSLAVKLRYWGSAALLLDDIGSLERGQETAHRSELLHQTLEYRKNRHLVTILTTNLTGQELRQHFGERSMQRLLEMCALVRMEGANLRLERPR